MPRKRNQTRVSLWPCSKDPSYSWSMGTEKLEEQVGRREEYILRDRKMINYKEKEESDVEE